MRSTASVRLDDKYLLPRGRVFMTALQALTRLPMLQRERDRAAGVNSAGFVSGYRGSPVAGLDHALHEAHELLESHQVRFVPGVNEEIAATACWGTHQLQLLPEPKVQGIFAMWYGKGPGVDRCVDVFKHANHAGTTPHGGVLVVVGDDHAARSSAVAHQSEHVFSACGMPVLAPADVQDILDFGLLGWAMSRYAGLWVGFKLEANVVESSATVLIDPQRAQPRVPSYALPPDGLHLRWPDNQVAQEHRMQAHKIYAAVAFARANGIDRLVVDPPQARLGLIACGKAWADLRQALDLLGIDDARAAELGLRLYKVGMPWPLEAEGARAFARGLQEILVIEEKRQIIEYQIKEMLYDRPDEQRPRVVGKFDEVGEWPAPPGQWLLPPTLELDAKVVARAVALRLARVSGDAYWLERARALEPPIAAPEAALARTPWFCPGCPHSRSTRVPEGSTAFGGVGCHLMAMWMERSTLAVSQMGGEGAAWIGMAPQAGVPHVFANMGDGTYFHSGVLAIRAAVAARVNITYKLLYNGAVAMTGGQPIDGELPLSRLTQQLAAEGVARIVVLADERRPRLDDYRDLAPGVEVRQRDQFEATQLELREVSGVSVLVFDQACATEQRRRIKRGSAVPPEEHVFINEMVCEGCGDCVVKSACLSVVSVATEFGSRRRIDPQTCNQDLACLKGLCPSLVTVRGARLRRPRLPPAPDTSGLPHPVLPTLERPWSILTAGVGGSGVVTVGALLGMAAHLDGRGVTVLDVTGLAQKGGAVASHVRIARTQELLHAVHIEPGGADALLAADLLVAAGPEMRRRLEPGRTRAVINLAEAPTGAFTRDPDLPFPAATAESRLNAALGGAPLARYDFRRLAQALLGEAIAGNIMLLGSAWQFVLIPLSLEALQRAVELNAIEVQSNLDALAWGRALVCDAAAVEAIAARHEGAPPWRQPTASLAERIARREAQLQGSHGAAVLRRYRHLLARVRDAERRCAPDSERLTEAVALQSYRMLAHKDVYEVARLHNDPGFRRHLEQVFEGDFKVTLHLAPPGFARTDPVSGEPVKRRWGAPGWWALHLLARLRRLRGSALDPFARGSEARLAQALRDEYLAAITAVAEGLRPGTLALALELAQVPAQARGYGAIFERGAQTARQRLHELRQRFEAASKPAHESAHG